MRLATVEEENCIDLIEVFLQNLLDLVELFPVRLLDLAEEEIFFETLGQVLLGVLFILRFENTGISSESLWIGCNLLILLNDLLLIFSLLWIEVLCKIRLVSFLVALAASLSKDPVLLMVIFLL